MHWYCAYTQPHLEPWARSNLWERGYEVYLPQYLRLRRHARRTDRVARPLFPRYLFVRADLAAGARRSIRTARGVVDLVAFGTDPSAVPDAVVDEIRRREDDEGYVVLDAMRGLKPGERVRIEGGAFADQVGLFEQVHDEQRVIVLLGLLGRAVRATVPVDRLERVG